MAYKLYISERAEEQLDHILQYIAVRLRNPEAARAVLDDVVDMYDYLREEPGAFAFCDDSWLAGRGYRKAVLKKHNYIMLYRIESDIVQISGIFHMKENYAAKL